MIAPLRHDIIQLMHTDIVGCKRWHFVSPLQTLLLNKNVGVFNKWRLDQMSAEAIEIGKWPI